MTRQNGVQANVKGYNFTSINRNTSRRKSSTRTTLLRIVLLGLFMSLTISYAEAWTAPVHGHGHVAIAATRKAGASSMTSLSMAVGGPTGAGGSREAEIRRKLALLKRQGKLKPKNDDPNTSSSSAADDDDYSNKIRQKLGSKKSKMMGLSADDDDDDDDDLETDPMTANSRRVQMGSLSEENNEDIEYRPLSASNEVDDDQSSTTSGTTRKPLIDPSLFDEDDMDTDEDLCAVDDEAAEDELLFTVALKMAEKLMAKEDAEEEARQVRCAEQILRLKEERAQAAEEAAKAVQAQLQAISAVAPSTATVTSELAFTTSGIGGAWIKNETAQAEATGDMYQPKSGSWGKFPRPKDISKTYGGGRRVGSGYTDTTVAADAAKQAQETRDKLQQYREKAGIDVQSEKDFATDIEEALILAGRAMQRGMYSTAVSALEKVTIHCSTNSKVGGKVFLELAMSYEAVGRTQEAVAVYETLSRCRIEEIKFNAKRLLYGLEAMQFMRDEVKSSEFSRKRAKNTFMDTTGFGDMASKFDNVYQTAYVDLERNSYKQLTQSVVRTSREARQIILRAVSAGEVERVRVVQALRALSRRFEDALQAEIVCNTPVAEPIAMMNGKPILQKPVVVETQETLQQLDAAAAAAATSTGSFRLTGPQQMMDNLNGEWRLQLLADKGGDGVKYFNSSVSWQNVDMETRTFSSAGPAGFVTVQQTGGVDFNEKRRILRRESIQVSGGGVLAGLFGNKLGAAGAVSAPQQVISVDSILLVTRGVPSKRGSTQSKEDEKDYFAVWRRVESGTYSNTLKSKSKPVEKSK